MKKKTVRRKSAPAAKKVVRAVHPLHRNVQVDSSMAVTALLVGFAVLIAVAMSVK